MTNKHFVKCLKKGYETLSTKLLFEVDKIYLFLINNR